MRNIEGVYNLILETLGTLPDRWPHPPSPLP
jgi:hypothetical protein